MTNKPNAFTLDLFGFSEYTFPPRAAGAMSLPDPLEGTETKNPDNNSNGRDKADRRAGPHQGPYVNNGKLPRSRNDDGTWRRKRSDAGKPRSK